VSLSRLRWFCLLAAFILCGASTTFAQQGGELFAAKCAMCHGKDAAGKTVMGAKLNIRDLNSAEVQKTSEAELTKVIADGKNKMPAYKAKLSKEQIAGLVAYVRSLGKK